MSTAMVMYAVIRRIEAGLSQRTLAKHMRTAQSAISDLERGKTDPQLGTYRRYWRGIGLRVSLVFWRRDKIDRVFEVGSAPDQTAPGINEEDLPGTTPVRRVLRPYRMHPISITDVRMKPVDEYLIGLIDA